MSTPAFNVDSTRFNRLVNDYAAAQKISVAKAFVIEARLLAKELMDRTPPLSGKAIKKVVQSRGQKLSNPATANKKAQQIGKRAVERDLRKMFYPIDKTVKPSVGTNFVYLFSSGDQNFGVPSSLYNPSPTDAWMRELRGAHRKNRGRVSYRGQESTRGKWTNLMRYPIPRKLFNSVLQKLFKAVGKAKGGWAEAFMRNGGRMSLGGWVGKHASKNGYGTTRLGDGKILITLNNRSPWANGGDPDRVIAASLAGRQRALAGALKRIIEGRWKKGRKL